MLLILAWFSGPIHVESEQCLLYSIQLGFPKYPRLWCLQSSAVETQTARVKMLKTQAATGKVSVAKLEQQQGVLSKMTVSAATHCRPPSPPLPASILLIPSWYLCVEHIRQYVCADILVTCSLSIVELPPAVLVGSSMCCSAYVGLGHCLTSHSPTKDLFSLTCF